MTTSEWISIKEKMPPTRTYVAFWYNNEPHIGYFIGKSENTGECLWQSHIDGYNCVSNVEYWYPLPKDKK